MAASVHCLVRPPSPRLADGLVTHIDRRPVDGALAVRQWRGYVDALEAQGWTTGEVGRVDAAPDGVFVEDALLMLGELAVITRPGAAERRCETASMRVALEALGRVSVELDEPACLDGGDVLKIGRSVYVGLGGRTNRHGIDALTDIASPHGFEVIAVPVTRVLHLKTAVTALPDGTVIGYPELVDDIAVFPRFLAVPEPDGAHVVVLDDQTVLMSTSAPQTADLLRRRGLHVVVVDISEFEKLEGCVTCLSVRLRTTS